MGAVFLHKQDKLERRTFRNAFPRRGDILEAILASTEVSKKLRWAQAFTHVTKEDRSPAGQVCWGWVREIQGLFGFIPKTDGH